MERGFFHEDIPAETDDFAYEVIGVDGGLGTPTQTAVAVTTKTILKACTKRA